MRVHVDQRFRVFALALDRACCVVPFFLRTSAKAAVSFFSFTALGKALLPREPWIVLVLEGLITSSASNKSSVTTAATATDSPKVTLLAYLETSSSRPTTVLKPEVDPATEPAELEGDCLLRGVESPRTPIWGVRVDATEIGEAVALVLGLETELKTDPLAGELHKLLRTCGISPDASKREERRTASSMFFGAAGERVEMDGSTWDSKSRDLACG